MPHPSTLVIERNVQDTSDNVDFIMEHLNDPNFDLTCRPPSYVSYVYEENKSAEGEVETPFDSDTRYPHPPEQEESRESTTFDFDENVFTTS